MPKEQGLRPIGDSIKIIIDKIRAEREAKRNKNKPIRTQPKLPGMKKGGQTSIKEEVKRRMRKETPRTGYGMGLSPVTHLRRHLHKKKIKEELKSPKPEHLSKQKVANKKAGGMTDKQKRAYGDVPRQKASPRGISPSQSRPAGKLRESYHSTQKPPQLRKSLKERKEKYRKEIQKRGGNVIFADEWDKIDKGLLKHLKKGGVKKAFGGQLMGQPTGTRQGALGGQQRPEPTSDQTLNVMQQNVRQKLGMKKGGKWSSGPKPGSLEYWQMSVQTPKKKASGGTSKGKGSSFMKEYKKRVYGRAKGGSMVQGPMKRARGSGAAIKGTRFQGTF